MNFEEMDFERADAADLIIERLLRFNKPFNYSETVSLKFYQSTSEELRKATADFNSTLALLVTKFTAVQTIAKREEVTQKALRRSIGGAESMNSDAYVAAGGTRQSDVIAKQQATRDEKRKVAEAKKKEEGDNAK